MRFLTITFLLFTLSLPKYLAAQERVINGVVFDNRNSYRISNATVTNTSNNSSVKTNELGLFEIRANVSDTLSILKTGYTEYFFSVNIEKELLIRLQPIINLSEVTIKGQTKKQELDEIKREFKKKSYFAGKPPILAYVFHPITALYEAFGKTPAMARRFNSYYTLELKESEINRRFNSTLVKELTHFEFKDLTNFMEIYRPQYELLASWGDYELINYINNSAIIFVKNGKPASTIKSLPKLPPAPDLSEKNIKIKEIKRIKL